MVVEEEDAEIKKRQDGQVYVPEHRGISRALRETIGGLGLRAKVHDVPMISQLFCS
jgi:hypothetical protein